MPHTHTGPLEAMAGLLAPLLSSKSTKIDGTTDSDDDVEDIPASQTIHLIGEVVGGYKLTYDADEKNGDDMKPYCVLHFGDKLIHKTPPAEGGCNPVWTVFTGAFFLLQTTPQSLVRNKLQVSTWTKRNGGPLKLSVLESNVCLGKAEIDLSKVPLNEERIDVDLHDGEFESGLKRGNLTLRFRLATRADERFLSLLKNRPELLRQRSTMASDVEANSIESKHCKDSLLVTETNESNKAGETFMYAITSAFTAKKYFDKKAGQHKVLVKPNPDPADTTATSYLTVQDIKYLTNEPSRQWVEAGSGTVGKVYLEILSCKDLPNVDVGEAVGNVTDAFVSAAFEDAMVQTPVIDDELSPHWLPWTQRAFIFKMMHPASTLYLAAFDFDLGISSHQPLGRVAVNVSNFQRDTDYTLVYNLYPSSNVTDRTASGSITIRLRIEYNNEKEALMAALRPRPTFHINVRKEKSLSVLRYTCFGEYGDDNEHPFDLTVTGSYINEIFEYKRDIGYCFGDAFRSLIFWRGQVRLVNLYIPLHSFLFFCAATTLVERPYLAPSFVLISFAWIMLATQTQRRQHPSPWYQCHSFWYYLSILRTGQSSCNTRPILANQAEADIKAYNKAWETRLAEDEMLAAKQAEMQQEIANLGDEAIHTKFPMGIPLAMFQRLTRYQGIIGRLCKKMRVIKTIVTWEEGAVSFWITFCFLAAGLGSLLLPWAFILLWTGRLVVWGLFGPHMMLVDSWLRANGKKDDLLEKAVENFHKESRFARIRRQEALKLRDMKCLAFGKYITLVPSHNLSRHFDRPLQASFAKSHRKSTKPIKLAPRGIPGQQLIGLILPKTESEVLKNKHDLLAVAKRQIALKRFIDAMKNSGSSSSSSSKFKRLVKQAAHEDDPTADVGYEVVVDKSDESVHEIGLESAKNSAAPQQLSTKSTIEATPNVNQRTIGKASDKQNKPKDSVGKRKSEVAKDCEKVPGTMKGPVRKGSKESSRSHALHKTRREQMPTVVEVEHDDECRECGEVEILWASPLVRDDPAMEEIDLHETVPDPCHTLHHEASVELNGVNVKFSVADDATVDLSVLRGKDRVLADNDNESTTSCIVFFQSDHEHNTQQSSVIAEDDCQVPQNVSFDDAPFSSDVSCVTIATRA